MRKFLSWLATAATLSFSVPIQASQNDPRLPQLFEQLKEARTAEEAGLLERAIWQIWLLSGNGTVDAHMLRGLQALGIGDNEAAISSFDQVVELQPDFAEAWNKRATANYMLGRFDASVIDIHKTLSLEPRHFGALSGLGLINLALGREHEALKVFEAALGIHPYLSGADTHIQELRVKLKGSGA